MRGEQREAAEARWTCQGQCIHVADAAGEVSVQVYCAQGKHSYAEKKEKQEFNFESHDSSKKLKPPLDRLVQRTREKSASQLQRETCRVPNSFSTWFRGPLEDALLMGLWCRCLQ